MMFKRLEFSIQTTAQENRLFEMLSDTDENILRLNITLLKGSKASDGETDINRHKAIWF